MISSTPSALKALFLFACAVKVAKGEFSCYSKVKGRCCFSPNGDDLRAAVQNYCHSGGSKSPAAKKYGKVLGDWCVEYVTDFSYVFDGKTKYNQPLTKWNTSSATTMNSMFIENFVFNQPLHFDTHKVVDVSYMFVAAYAFNQPLQFDTSNVKNMAFMFANAVSFNQPVPFDTSKVKSMSAMFKNANAFNQDVSAFQVGGQIRDLSRMFEGALSFSQNLTAWSGFLRKGTVVTQMFAATACPVKDTPNLTAIPQGPFCYPVL
jgi:hypothetical protein